MADSYLCGEERCTECGKVAAMASELCSACIRGEAPEPRKPDTKRMAAMYRKGAETVRKLRIVDLAHREMYAQEAAYLERRAAEIEAGK